jgi:hypothetical protein
MAHRVRGGQGSNPGEGPRGTQLRYERWSKNIGGTEPTLALLKQGEMGRTQNRHSRIKRVD